MSLNNSIIEAYCFGSVLYAVDSSTHISVKIILTNNQIIEKIISGESRGLSPEIKIKRWICSICNQDYEECIHERGNNYEGKTCAVYPKDTEATGGSIVSTPKDPRCQIDDLLVIEELSGKKKYTWYGFKTMRYSSRYKNIQSALDDKNIPEQAAFRFSAFYSQNFVGVITYP